MTSVGTALAAAESGDSDLRGEGDAVSRGVVLMDAPGRSEFSHCGTSRVPTASSSSSSFAIITKGSSAGCGEDVAVCICCFRLSIAFEVRSDSEEVAIPCNLPPPGNAEPIDELDPELEEALLVPIVD